MYGIKSCRKMLGIMLIMVLLSFFCVTQERITAPETYSAMEGACDKIRAGETPLTQTGSTARLANAHSMLEEAEVPEQRQAHVTQVRFLLMECLLFYLSCIVCDLVIRRFGCRMIALWENIVYIHQTDGEKGKSLLYT